MNVDFDMYLADVQAYLKARYVVLPAVRKGFEAGMDVATFSAWYKRHFALRPVTTYKD